VFDRSSDETVLIVCERGYGKRTALGEYPTKNRGGMGVIAIKASERNGPVAGLRLTRDEDHLILISTTRRLIRIPVNTVPVLGRATQGVRIMQLDDGERVASSERLVDPQDSEDIAEGAAPSVPVAGVRIPCAEDDLILISTTGRLIRIPVNPGPVVGRAAQGVRIMRLDDGERVESIERLVGPQDSEDIAEGAAREAA